MPIASLSLQARLRRTVRVVRALILLGALLLVANAAYTWISPDYALQQAREITHVDCITRLTRNARLLGALFGLLPLSVLLLALLRLWRLFGEYGQGRVFSQRALACLHGFALCLVASAVISPIHGALLSVISTWANPPGQRDLSVNVESQDYLMLLFGLVLIAISRVMAEGARVTEDNAGFV